MKKRFLLCLLTIVCLAALVIVLPVSASEVRGTCGENVTWVLDNASGTLTISGRGDMGGYDHTPWFDYRDVILSVVIEDGVTSIGYRAFASLQKMTSVTIPDSVQKVEAYAFDGCRSLESISLPDNISYLGQYAFRGCSKLTAITIPKKTTQISHGMFSDCRSLRTVNMHSGITEIADNGFYGCIALTSVTLPDSIKTIGGGAFRDCANLTSITLSKNLVSLGGNAFSGCTSLTEITIPNGVDKILGYTFSGCTALKQITFGSGVAEIDPFAISGCKQLAKFVFSKSNPNFYVDSHCVIYTKDKKELVLFPMAISGTYEVPTGTEKICHYACYEHKNLTGLVIPGSVTVIDDYAFDACTKLKSVSLSHGVEIIGTYSFARTAITEITIPATVTKIKSVAFSDCTNLSEIYFYGDAPVLSEAAFAGVKAIAYYPEGNRTWDYLEGNIWDLVSWKPYSVVCNHTEIVDKGYAATCTKDGLTDGTHCSVCGKVLTEQKKIKAKGHSYGQWKETKAPTVEETGLKERTCSVCGKVDKKTIDKLPPEETVPPTTEPPETVPPITEPPETVPPTTEPPETVPPTTEPPETVPPTTEPPETNPPTTVPQETVAPTEPEIEPTDPVPENDSDSTPWGIIIAIGAAVLVAGAGGLVLIKKRRK